MVHIWSSWWTSRLENKQRSVGRKGQERRQERLPHFPSCYHNLFTKLSEKTGCFRVHILHSWAHFCALEKLSPLIALSRIHLGTYKYITLWNVMLTSALFIYKHTNTLPVFLTWGKQFAWSKYETWPQRKCMSRITTWSMGLSKLESKGRALTFPEST